MVRPRQIAKAALFNQAGEVLLLTRASDDNHRPNEPDFPGGTIDPGESPLQGGVREIFEEIGVQLDEEDITISYTDTTCIEGIYRIRYLCVGSVPVGSEIQLSHEHSAYQWVAPDLLPTMFEHPVWVGGLQFLKENNLL